MTGEFLGDPLIFILSQPRAGSTLLQTLLANHPQIATAPEPWLLLHPIYGLRHHGHQAEFNSQWAFKAVRAFAAPLSDDPADPFAAYRQALRAFAAVLYRAALARAHKDIFLDKTPRYYFILPELLDLFPHARFIFLLRNPLAVLSSILNTWVKGDWPRLAEFEADLRLAPCRLADAIHTLGDAAIVLHYETLVADPVAALTALYTRLGLPPPPNTLPVYDPRAPLPTQGAALSLPQDTAPRLGDQSGLQQHDRPVPDHLATWRQLADHPQTHAFALAYLADLGDDLIARLGYDPAALRQVLSAPPASAAAPLIPWELALCPPARRTPRQRLQIARVQALQQDGPWRGRWRFLRRHWRPLARSLFP